MSLFGLSFVELVFCKLLMIACNCSNAFSHCSSESKSGWRWGSAIFVVRFDHFDWPLVCAWYAVKKSRSIFNFLMIAPQSFATNCLLQSKKFALSSLQLTQLSWLRSSIAYFLAPQAIFLAINVTCLLYLSVTNMAESKPSENIGRARMKSIVIV